VGAFAVGELKWHSQLGQPLQALAPLALDPGEEIVSVGLGGNSDFLTLNLPRKPVVNQISARLAEQDGGVFVALHSAQPIREADFYLVLRIASNYHTYFPFLRVRPPAGEAATPAASKGVPVATALPEGGDALSAAVKQGKESQEKLYGPVRAKEGLRDVARRFVKRTPFSVQQVEVAIWRRNPQHFTRNNMNGLKAGAKLTIPGHDEIAKISKKEAKELRISQAAEWKKPGKERQTVTAPPPAPQPDKAADKAVGKVPEKAVSVAPEDKVTLPAAQGEAVPAASPRVVAKESPPGKEVAVLAHEQAAPAGKEGDHEQVKVESGTLKAILVQLQTITRVLENHHERQEQLEKRVTVLEKNQEQREQLEKRVTALERAVKEWNYITKEHRAAGSGK
jgi:FimV-like protein